jgi:hypothetical protein
MNTLADYLVEQVLKEMNEGITVMLPGGFKPPHAGHLELAKRYAAQPNVSEVKILIGPKERDGITLQQSMDIWRLLLRGATGVKVEQAPNDNPMRAAYEFIEQAAPGTYTLGSSSKGKDYDRVKMFVAGHADATATTPAGKYNRPNVSVVELPMDVSPMTYSGRDDDKNGQGISASVLRADLAAGNYNNFKTNYPGLPESTTKAVYNILTSKMQLSEAVIGQYLEKIKTRFKEFLKAIKDEGVDTKNAFSLLLQAAVGKKQLSKQEKEQIGNQMKEALKASGLVAASVLPGGTIYFILIRLLKLDDYLLPKKFLSKNAASAGTLAMMERSLYEWKPVNGKVMLKEGGAAGHMSHPFDDLELSFQDAKNMIDAALSGKVEFAQEKLDGQNLMVTYKDGKVRAARNKGQLKNYAENSITADQLDQMMSGKGAVQTAFVEAMRDMESAINKLDPKQKEDFFQNGKKFINFEVLFPGTTNVVPYGATQLRLHGFKEYDQDGNVVDEDSEGALQLQAAIDKVKAQDQKTYQIRITDPITLNKTKDYERQKEELLKALDVIRKTYNLKDQDKVSLYFQAWWKNYIEQRAKELGYQVSDNTMQQLINRWGFGDKSTNIKAIRQGVDNQDFLKWIDEFDKSGVAAQQKEAKRPLENLFLKLGVYVLQNIQQLVAINPNDSMQKMRDDLAASIKGIRAAAQSPEMQDDDRSIQFLKRELQRLQDLGGFKAIVPTEGIVFKYQGKVYKLTGAFAPVNQIIGYLKFGR